MDPAIMCQCFFGLITAGSIAAVLIEPVKKSMADYGSRAEPADPSIDETPQKGIPALLQYVASYQVPHSWFVHYYFASVASSLFWGWQILVHGIAFRVLASYSHGSTSGGMSVNQVFLTWFFMTVQGARRLYEDITLSKPSQSKMWIGLWLLGIAYYLAVGISVWVEGIPALDVPETPLQLLRFSKASMKTSLAIGLFAIGSGIQHECHVHLAGLKKYTLPQHRFFKKIVCPHYTSECLIYIALAIMAAPKGQYLNKTMVSGLIFVIANLAATADSSRKWYIKKFGAENLQERWRMVPYVW
ncbi:3-oxo-5-alpha-steroid 4-dehydrogenase [Phlyctema vagabunda]|uniref:Polyprenal reductase n=1 Tax=Phlyctema vagabunda TaxID=108571 RepID=A0ABR4PRV4_9HELO